MIVPVGHMPLPPLQPPSAAAGQPTGQVTSLFLQLLTQVQGQQTDALALEGSLLSRATPAPEDPESQALESILQALEGIVPYLPLPLALPPAGQPLAEDLLALNASQVPVQTDIRQMPPIGPWPDTTPVGGGMRQDTTLPPGVPGASALLAPEPQDIVAARPDAGQSATADGMPLLAVLPHMGETPQDGEAVLGVYSTPTTAALPQSNTSDLEEASPLEGVSFPSLPPTVGASFLPADVQEPFTSPVLRPDLAAVTKQAGHLSHNTIMLQLEPPELGHLRVQVRLTDERLAAAFWAESSEVRTLLHTHLPMLQHALTQQGFQTQQISIALATDGLIDYSGQFSQQHSAFQSFSQGGEQGTPGSIRDTLIAPGMTTDKYTHDGLVNVVI